ncbi:hypothetical protein J4443_02040 [Candidatus Woesearchaeota archaeon]|nr:hypothetical protein [Candidatus Woesearchaeota archaeon]
MKNKINLPKRFWDDSKWAHQNFGELQQRYTNKWVAIVNKKVAGVVENGDIARRIAVKKIGVKEIPVVFVESGHNLH